MPILPKAPLVVAALVVVAAVALAVASMLAFRVERADSEAPVREARQLRVVLAEQLPRWFPQPLTPDNSDWQGLALRIGGGAVRGSRIVLVHGIDEPGSIWHDLIPVLDAAGFEVWEFRYPSDRSIEWSVNDLAERWSELPANRSAVFIGHSMGGLIVRDFIARWRHPVATPARVAGAAIRGAILIGTPNQGAEWARLRIWLELRDQLLSEEARRRTLFAALRDGTGKTGSDLWPGSEYLGALNATPWPNAVPIRLIGGVLPEPPAALIDSVTALVEDAPSGELKTLLATWWSALGGGLGDGVVTQASLNLPQVPPPLLVPASHRSLLLRFLSDDPEPPAIAPILRILNEWVAPRETPPPASTASNRNKPEDFE